MQWQWHWNILQKIKTKVDLIAAFHAVIVNVIKNKTIEKESSLSEHIHEYDLFHVVFL